MAYFCDGPCGMRGEPRGKSGATPQGWVCVVVEGKMRHLCLDCEKRRRAEMDGT